MCMVYPMQPLSSLRLCDALGQVTEAASIRAGDWLGVHPSADIACGGTEFRALNALTYGPLFAASGADPWHTESAI